jgi:hypothetical protein
MVMATELPRVEDDVALFQRMTPLLYMGSVHMFRDRPFHGCSQGWHYGPADIWYDNAYVGVLEPRVVKHFVNLFVCPDDLLIFFPSRDTSHICSFHLPCQGKYKTNPQDYISSLKVRQVSNARQIFDKEGNFSRGMRSYTLAWYQIRTCFRGRCQWIRCTL